MIGWGIGLPFASRLFRVGAGSYPKTSASMRAEFPH